MDSSDSGVIAIVGLIVSIGGAVLAMINHKRIRSTCCGKKLETSLDIEDTTPVKIYQAPSPPSPKGGGGSPSGKPTYV
jgi:hypothetical protein